MQRFGCQNIAFALIERRKLRMGIMDKLKAMKNAVTGGGAKVQLEAVNPTKGSPFTVKVRATVGDADLKIDKVYVNVAGVETIEIDVPVEEKDEKQNVVKKTERKSAETNTHNAEIVLAGAQTLTAKQEYQWEGTVQLPETASSTYSGVNAKHEWKLLAGLSTFGNDPDSGWITVEIL